MPSRRKSDDLIFTRPAISWLDSLDGIQMGERRVKLLDAELKDGGN